MVQNKTKTIFVNHLKVNTGNRLYIKNSFPLRLSGTIYGSVSATISACTRLLHSHTFSGCQSCNVQVYKSFQEDSLISRAVKS